MYISKENIQLANDLAQKDYLIKLRKAACELSQQVNAFISTYDESLLSSIYYNLSPVRQKLVNPYYISDEDFIHNWINAPYKTKGGFADDWDIVSLNGEPMRSKSETWIASMLSANHIPYRYEPEIILDDGTTFHPDFLILNKRTLKEYYWEHLGMIGSEGYANHVVERNNIYVRNGIIPGINLIYTFETSERRTSQTVYETYIKTYLL